jgi:hypothetical protein
MIHAKPILKVGAVASAGLLIAGFVCYRAGAFDRYVADEKGAEIVPLQEQPPAGATGSDPLLMSGSKSDRVITPGPATPAEGKPKLPAYIGGSKSLAPLIPPDKAAPPSTPAPNAPPTQTQQPSR